MPRGAPREAPRAVDKASALRLQLYRARNVAHERACESRHLDASEINHALSSIASRWCFRRLACAEDLEQILMAVRQIHAACILLETLEAAQ